MMASASLEATGDDAALVAAVRRGDDRAFEALYRRYQRRIHAYVLGLVGDHGRAEDVTQEVFVSALRRMRATEQPLAFKPWLFQIAKNACIDAFRRSRRAEEVSYDDAERLAPADHSRLVGRGPSPDAAVAVKQDLDDLCGAFGGLSETHHEILVLRELEGRSYAEIGAQLGMSRPAVESTLFRARRRLSEEYDDIVSGARCARVRGMIAALAPAAAGTRAGAAGGGVAGRSGAPQGGVAEPRVVESRAGVAGRSGAPQGGAASLGARDGRRLARHLAHCQSCRREAIAAGLDRGLFTRPSVRERVAALLGFPVWLRVRRGADEVASAAAPSGRWTAHLPLLADQVSGGGWGKAAAGVAVLLAGVGAGTGVRHVAPPAKPAAVTAATTTSSSAAADAAQRASGAGVAARPRSAAHPARRHGGSRPSNAADRATSVRGGPVRPVASARGGGAEHPAGGTGVAGGEAGAAGGGGAGGSAGGAASTATGAASTADRAASTAGGAGKTATGTARPAGGAAKTATGVAAGAAARVTTEVAGAVNAAVSAATGAVGAAGTAVGGTISKVTGGGSNPAAALPQTVQTTVEQTTGTVQATTQQTTGTVRTVTAGGPLADTVDHVTDRADRAVAGAGEAVDGVAKQVTGILGG